MWWVAPSQVLSCRFLVLSAGGGFPAPKIASVTHGRAGSAHGGPSPAGCREHQPSDGEGAAVRQERGKAADGTLTHQRWFWFEKEKVQHPLPLRLAPKPAAPAGSLSRRRSKAPKRWAGRQSPPSKHHHLHVWFFSRWLWQRPRSPAGKRPRESGVLLRRAVHTSGFGTWRCCRLRRDLHTLGCHASPKPLSPWSLLGCRRHRLQIKA